MFASRSVAIHVLRGFVGFGSLAAVMLAPISPWWSVGLVPVALVALGGCPACWTMGLIETISRRATQRRRTLPPSALQASQP